MDLKENVDLVRDGLKDQTDEVKKAFEDLLTDYLRLLEEKSREMAKS